MNMNKNIYRQPVKGRSNEATVFLFPGTSYKPGMLHHLDSSKKPTNSEEEGVTVIQPGGDQHMDHCLIMFALLIGA